MKRRDFLTATAVGATAIALQGCHRAEEETTKDKSVNINRGKKTTLKLATSWPAHFPIMGTGVDRFAARCKEMSGGSLEIKVFAKMANYSKRVNFAHICTEKKVVFSLVT